MNDQLIFRTEHGSHLYGLSHEGSDRDIYEVYDKPGHTLRQQFLEDGMDVVRGGIWAFVNRALTGSHQSCEALFSGRKEWTDYGWNRYGAFIEGLRVAGGDVVEKYERTIRKFAYSDYKRRRHSVRLYFNLHDLRRCGRFNPTLDGIQIPLVNEIARLYEGDALAEKLEVRRKH